MKEKQLEKVQKLLEMVSEEYVKPEEITEVFEALVLAIKNVREQLEQAIADTKGQVSNEFESVLYDLKTKELRLETLINQSKEFALAEVRKVSQQLNSEVIRIESMMPSEVDLSHLERKIDEKIDELEKKIPEIPEDLKPEQVRDKLEKLKGDERLDISAIKGIGKRLSKLTDEIINRAIGILDQRTSFLIQKVSNLSTRVDGINTSGSGHTIEDEGSALTARTSLNFVGAGVTAADSGGKTVVTISGGAGLSVETPTGTVDDSNVTFTVANEPKFLSINGGVYVAGTGLYTSYVAGTITLSSAVGTGGFIRSFY